jgi:hypothetical protein
MTAVAHTNWLELLEVSCAKASISCLDVIIDQAGSATPWLPSVLSVEPAIPWHSLFTGLPEAGADELAPLLVRIDLAQPLQRQWLIGLMQALHGGSQLLVLASHWPFQHLAECLGRCLEAVNGGYPGLLRYYDPRVFPLLFSHVLEPAQQHILLAPAVFWSWLDRDGSPQRLLGSSQPPDRPECFSLIELSDDQVDILGCVSDATLVVKRLRDAFPLEWGAERRFRACYVAMIEATEAGLLSDFQREAFVLEKVRTTGVESPWKPGK